MANPKNFTWTGPTQYIDDRPYGEVDHGGYELEINGDPGVAVPVAWNTLNVYQFPIASLPHIRQGDNVVRLRAVAANGQVSEWTAPVTFLYLSVPKAPTNLSVV